MDSESNTSVRLESVSKMNVGSPLDQCRAAPVWLGGSRLPSAVVTAHGADFDVDPYIDMFFFPTGTLKITLFGLDGVRHWHRDLGRGVVPGMWFCPVFPFDLDNDGIDEIYFVNNTDAKHPLSLRHYCLEGIDAKTGKTLGQWPWPMDDRYDQSQSHACRHFILGGMDRGTPVLVIASGTYNGMHLRGFTAGMTPKWEFHVAATAPGARGSHMCSVVDINHDGVDELMWGERCISFADGRELFCCDRDVYRGHSDIIQPVLDSSGRWKIYTCRENDPTASPRVVMFDDQGKRLWGHVEKGHIDIGWVARLGEHGEHVGSAIRIDSKTCGPDGREHQGREEFTFDCETGRAIKLGFDTYRTLPVDINGDGRHELYRHAKDDGELMDRHGNILGRMPGSAVLLCKLVDRPGEQILAANRDGTIELWADRNAADSPKAQRRYEHPFYRSNMRLTATGYNLKNLGGI